MAIRITKVEVWSGSMPDQPGALDAILAPLAAAGANLECVIGRRQAGEGPGQGVVYLTPVQGKKVQAAARAAGLKPAGIGTLRVESPNKKGVGHKLLAAIAGAGINMRGISTIAGGTTAVAYIGFDSVADATRAAAALKAAARR